jgi:hypothetical protein
MAFGVNVTTRTALAASGSVPRTGTLFLCGPVDEAMTAPVDLYSVSDFEGLVQTRETLGIPSWDAVQAGFQMGLSRIVFAGFVPTTVMGATTYNYDEALTLIDDPKLGPGQLAVVGAPPTQAMFADMQSAAMATNRVVLRDVRVDATLSQMVSDAAFAPVADEYGATFGPWLIVPPAPGVIGGAARKIPASIAIAALCNQVDAKGNPNRAAAGDDFPIPYATALDLEISDTDRATLFTGGCNAFDDENGIENWGFQTNVPFDANTGDPYWQFNCSRARMALVDNCRQRARPFMFRNIDGRGRLTGALQAAIEDECNALWGVDAMYGDTAQDAYNVNVSTSVNTVASISSGAIVAIASVVWSLHAKEVDVELVTIPLGSPVS